MIFLEIRPNDESNIVRFVYTCIMGSVLNPITLSVKFTLHTLFFLVLHFALLSKNDLTIRKRSNNTTNSEIYETSQVWNCFSRSKPVWSRLSVAFQWTSVLGQYGSCGRDHVLQRRLLLSLNNTSLIVIWSDFVIGLRDKWVFGSVEKTTRIVLVQKQIITYVVFIKGQAVYTVWPKIFVETWASQPCAFWRSRFRCSPLLLF